MHHSSLGTLALLLASTAAVTACSSGAPAGASAAAVGSWDCHGVEVPNGQAVECTGSASSAYTESGVCYAGTAGCPTTTTLPPQDGAGGCPIGDGSSSCVGTGADAGAGTLPGRPSSGAPELSDSNDDSCWNDDDDGHGHLQKGNGGGQGNASGGGNGHGHGKAGGGSATTDTCACQLTADAGGGGSTGTYGGGSAGTSGGGSTGTYGGGSTGTSGGGSTGGGSGDFTCVTSSGKRVCTSTTPTCAAGTHAAACGACLPDGVTADCQPPSDGGCWVTGGGFIDAGDGGAEGKDTFGGNAMPMKSGAVRGEWQHVTHATGDKMHGQVRYLTCRIAPGAGPGHPSGGSVNQAYYGGEARWFTGGAWQDGYWFDAVVEDHGEPGRDDSYHVTVRQNVDPSTSQSGTIVYQAKGKLGGGNIQIHAPNAGHPATSSPLPAWVALEP